MSIFKRKRQDTGSSSAAGGQNNIKKSGAASSPDSEYEFESVPNLSETVAEAAAEADVDDEEIIRRIRIRRKKRRRRKKIFRLSLLALICVLVALDVHYAKMYYDNLMVTGGDVLDGDAPIVQTAKKELGNYGGEKFWKWYGFDYHVDWCAAFVSWCADQNGMIDDGKVPMSAYVPEEVAWFQNKGMWKDPGWKDPGAYTPKAGDIIFFDWEHDGSVDHVGIVASCFRGRVFTIEGNSGFKTHDEKTWLGRCQRNGYNINSKDIYGYGLTEK